MHQNVIETLGTLEEVEFHENSKSPLLERQMKKINLLISQVQMFITEDLDEDERIKKSLK